MTKAKQSNSGHRNDDYLLRRNTHFDGVEFDELEDEVIAREYYLDSHDSRRDGQYIDLLVSESQVDLRLDHHDVMYSDEQGRSAFVIDPKSREEITDTQHYFLQNRLDIRSKVKLRRIVSKGLTQMAIAKTQNVKTWVSLPAGFRTFMIQEAREFLGQQRDENNELGSIVALTYVGKEKVDQMDGEGHVIGSYQPRITQNYSLSKPTFLKEVLVAICNGDEDEAQAMLESIDWATADAEKVFDIEVQAYVTPTNFNGRPSNGIGRVLRMGHPEANMVGNRAQQS